MTADRLRQAAQKIRDTAGATQEGPWYTAQDPEPWTGEEDAAHIALWSPPVALTVGELLEYLAASPLPVTAPGLRAISGELADLILGSGK